jgi:hypothetical protein
VEIQPPGALSDHSFISVVIHRPSPPSSSAGTSTRLVRPWRRLDVNAFASDVQMSCLCSDDFLRTGQDADLDSLCASFDLTLTELIDRHAPLTLMTYRTGERCALWFDRDCKLHRRETRSFERRMTNARSPADKDRVKSDWLLSLKSLHRLYRTKRSTYWTDKINKSSSGSSKLWQTFQHLLGREARQTCPLDSITLSDFFVDKVNEVRLATAAAPPPDFSTSTDTLLTAFRPLATDDVVLLIKSASNKTCNMDPIPTWLIQACARLSTNWQLSLPF